VSTARKTGDEHRPPRGRVAGTGGRFAVGFHHRVLFTSDVFRPDNGLLAATLAAGGAPGRSIAFIDNGVAAAWPGLTGAIERYAAAHPAALDLVARPQIVAGGEAAKNDLGVVDAVLRAVHEHGICRRSWVIAIGGGAMLDAVGFAAATAHRGVRLIRIPTTTLAQGDAAVGVKNGVNLFGKKNFLGCFSVPWAVINDEAFLSTLSDRDWRSGLSEAVKVALLKDASDFDRIAAIAPRLRQRDEAALRPILRRGAELHLRHIIAGGDPFELASARPLDFGHWAAHKLESLTGFRLRHGEAVAIGLAVDTTYSSMAGLLRPLEAEAVLRCLETIGFELADPALDDAEALMRGLEEFREHLGGQLTITLLRGHGRPVDVHEIDPELMRSAIAAVRARVAPGAMVRTLSA
jgi:3-dehydroquinate synthase